jgi:hypothetical protein
MITVPSAVRRDISVEIQPKIIFSPVGAAYSGGVILLTSRLARTLAPPDAAPAELEHVV